MNVNLDPVLFRLRFEQVVRAVEALAQSRIGSAELENDPYLARFADRLNKAVDDLAYVVVSGLHARGLHADHVEITDHVRKTYRDGK